MNPQNPQRGPLPPPKKGPIPAPNTIISKYDSLTTHYQNIPIVVVLWEKEDFQGRKVYVVQDTPDLEIQTFSKQAKSIGLHPGPNFDASKHYAVELFDVPEYAPPSRRATLNAPGEYPDLTPYGAVANIVSIRFVPGVVKPKPIKPIPVVVELVSKDAQKQVHRVVIVENVADLQGDTDLQVGGIDHYGEGEFAGSLCDVKVYKGPNWVPGAKASFYKKTGCVGRPVAEMEVDQEAPWEILGTSGGHPENWILSICINPDQKRQP